MRWREQFLISVMVPSRWPPQPEKRSKNAQQWGWWIVFSEHVLDIGRGLAQIWQIFKIVGSPAQDLTHFQMVPIPIVSILTSSTSSPDDILTVSKKILHNPPGRLVECDNRVLGGISYWILVGLWLGFSTTIIDQTLLLNYWLLKWLYIIINVISHIANKITIIVPTHVVMNVTSSTLAKCANLHTILASIYKSKSACIHNTWSIPNCLFVCVKSVGKVSGNDSGDKCVVGAATAVVNTG